MNYLKVSIGYASTILASMEAVHVYGRGHESGPFAAGTRISGLMRLIDGGQSETWRMSAEDIARKIKSEKVNFIHLCDEEDTRLIVIHP